MNGKIGFPGGKPNGTGLSTGNFSKKREYLQRYSSFLVFTGITGKSLYHLLYHTSTMLLGKNTRFRSRKWRRRSCFSVQHAVFSVLIWTPLSVIAVRLQVHLRLAQWSIKKCYHWYLACNNQQYIPVMC